MHRFTSLACSKHVKKHPIRRLLHNVNLRHTSTHKRLCADGYCSTYTSCGESNHWEENDAEFSLWHLCADGSEHCHHST